MSRKHQNLRSTDQFDNTDRFSVENYHCAIQAAMFFTEKWLPQEKANFSLYCDHLLLGQKDIYTYTILGRYVFLHTQKVMCIQSCAHTRTITQFMYVFENTYVLPWCSLLSTSGTALRTAVTLLSCVRCACGTLSHVCVSSLTVMSSPSRSVYTLLLNTRVYVYIHTYVFI